MKSIILEKEDFQGKSSFSLRIGSRFIQNVRPDTAHWALKALSRTIYALGYRIKAKDLDEIEKAWSKLFAGKSKLTSVEFEIEG